MKKFLIVLFMLFSTTFCFAKTIQKVVKYQVYTYEPNMTSAIDITPSINAMINKGWLVKSITPISKVHYYANPTDYVIVVYEKEEE